MDPLTIALLASQAVAGLGKMVGGLVSRRKAMRSIESGVANLPKYRTPESYKSLLNLAKTRAGSVNQLEGMLSNKIEQQQASSLRSIERAAPSSTVAIGAATDVFGRTLDAVRDLGLMSLQWRDRQAQALEQVYNQGINIENTQFQVNQRDPAMIKLNMLAEKYKMGTQSASQGFNMFASGIANLGRAKLASDLYGSNKVSGESTGESSNEQWIRDNQDLIKDNIG